MAASSEENMEHNEDYSDTEMTIEESETVTPTNPKKKGKKKVPVAGVVYLSRIPACMNVKKIREVFGQYGEVGRVFLQPDTKTEKSGKSKKNRRFTEGWVEFLDKRIAKKVAVSLNNKQVGGKRRSPWYEELWNIKYLNRFKWGHLNERLAYEKAVHKQRLRTEIAQVKRETNFFIQNVEKNKIMKRLEKKKKAPAEMDTREWTYQQNQPRGQDKEKGPKGGPKGSHIKVAVSASFLKTIFSGGVADQNEDAS